MNIDMPNDSLPFITFPENNLKTLIDTVSTRSFIKPTIAPKLFNKFFRVDSFQIKTTHDSSREKYTSSITIPASKIFRTNEQVKFHLFDFHGYFDCLIGMDIIKHLGLIFDI